MKTYVIAGLLVLFVWEVLGKRLAAQTATTFAGK